MTTRPRPPSRISPSPLSAKPEMLAWAATDDTTPLVFLHGFTGNASSFGDVAGALRSVSTRAMAAPPLLGHGAAASYRRTAGTDGFTAEVNRIAACIREVSREPVHLVGYSMGARVALGVVVCHPTVVARATLIGVHPGLTTADERRARQLADQRWIELLETRGIEAFVDEWEQLPLWQSQSELPAEARARQRRARLEHTAEGLAAAMHALGLGRMPSYGPSLESIATPIQLVAGEHDRKFRTIAARMWDPLPNAHISIVPDCGHNAVLERPDYVADLIAQHDVQARHRSK